MGLPRARKFASCSTSFVRRADGTNFSAAWKWVIDVNLFGVVHGHRVFLPKMIEQDEGHIINTASMAGHFPGH
ncbi:MAG: SDR family NAD(P)-dependent oxidoreductase, partial [Verrucomicrobiota bacterium]